ncbi:Steroidogenic acute regulatory protein, mitochondrial [Frankliniella fusca]|uniref:Steroidogenic acute regulatory protein, mitochondrial n=1 Tax=Frankliniella fusca TaxID=407009 RepID=A0AAE1HPW8_9NEOP|nr:Steroidogenic acute regulatory protein, mitochondrial [Frankliniella fusca]
MAGKHSSLNGKPDNGSIVDTSQWVARVQFPTHPRGPFTVPVSSLSALKKVGPKTYKSLPWEPRTPKDYDPKIWYGVKTDINMTPGSKPTVWKAHIGRITETAAEMEKQIQEGTRRIVFPPVSTQDQDSEVESTANEEEGMRWPKQSSNPITMAREIRRSGQIAKQRIHNKMYKDYMRSEQLEMISMISTAADQEGYRAGSESDSGDEIIQEEDSSQSPVNVVNPADAGVVPNQVEELKKLLAEERKQNAQAQEAFLAAIMVAVGQKVETIVSEKVAAINCTVSSITAKITSLEERVTSSSGKSFESKRDFVISWLNKIPPNHLLPPADLQKIETRLNNKRRVKIVRALQRGSGAAYSRTAPNRNLVR